jgi:hypothetical protein
MESSGVSKPSSCLPNPLTFRSIRVQPGATRSDNHGNYGFYGPYGYCVGNIAPYTGGRHNGLASDRTYTEDGIGSSPIAPTTRPPRYHRGGLEFNSSQGIDQCWN